MKATTMKVLDKKNPNNELFGVKISISGNRCVYLVTEKGLYNSASKAEAKLKADEINRTLEAEPNCLDRVKNDKSIKCVLF